jgi:hypothetical protein
MRICREGVRGSELITPMGLLIWKMHSSMLTQSGFGITRYRLCTGTRCNGKVDMRIYRIRAQPLAAATYFCEKVSCGLTGPLTKCSRCTTQRKTIAYPRRMLKSEADNKTKVIRWSFLLDTIFDYTTIIFFRTRRC